jgi:signal peptidase II
VDRAQRETDEGGAAIAGLAMISRNGLGLSLVLGLFAFALDRLHKFVQVSADCFGGSCPEEWGLFRPENLTGWRGGETIAVTPFFEYVLVWNTGISYGLFGSMPIWVIAALVTVAMIALAIWWLRSADPLVRAGLALCLGGALSNALDRAIYGAVADFFHFHWGEWSFYIFNLADVAISLGVVLLILDFLGIGRARAPKPA